MKTPEEILQKHYVLDKGLNNPEYVINAMKEYSSELIKENERLKGTLRVEGLKELLAAREENKELREALTKAVDTSNMVPLIKLECKSVLSKFQPKKDETESNNQPAN